MCGIALILSGAHILRPECAAASPPEALQEQEPGVSADDLTAILRRRGPDSIGSRRVFLSCGSEAGKDGLASRVDLLSEDAVPDSLTTNGASHIVDMQFIGATLQLRGEDPVSQPLVDDFGNLLLYNGEIFGGIHVDTYQNDTEVLLNELGCCSSCDSQGPGGKHDTTEHSTDIPHVLSTIRGPWSIIYWQSKSKTIWFGRDPFGRRSLLVHWPTSIDKCFMLSSVAPSSSSKSCDGHISSHSLGYSENLKNSDTTSWEELPCGIYSIHVGYSNFTSQEIGGSVAGQVKKYEWSDHLIKKLMMRRRSHIDPIGDCQSETKQPDRGNSVPLDESDRSFSGELGVERIKNYTALVASTNDVSISCSLWKNAGTSLAYNLLVALRDSVARRTILTSTILRGQMDSTPVAVLFSGGLDSMILAALLDKCLSSKYPIDLLNVSFDGLNAPDRISGRAGFMELKKVSPTRRWRLVEINAELKSLSVELQHVMALIKPSKTYMDLNIGIALWLAARGEGFVVEEISDLQENDCSYCRYRSIARILLVGSGADEQCAGYGRHRTKYRLGSWKSLEEEMKLDMQRIWRRNLGRDDRCISDHGKEARFPFLDEKVVELLLDLPLWEIANLDEPIGRGDKKILREVAKLLGLEGAASLPKRAIQFGSRIARESNKQNFGSNRAANQASAGSVLIGELS